MFLRYKASHPSADLNPSTIRPLHLCPATPPAFFPIPKQEWERGKQKPSVVTKHRGLLFRILDKMKTLFFHQIIMSPVSNFSYRWPVLSSTLSRGSKKRNQADHQKVDGYGYISPRKVDFVYLYQIGSLFTTCTPSFYAYTIIGARVLWLHPRMWLHRTFEYTDLKSHEIVTSST